MEHETDPPIVGIGASAGGVRALQILFESVPNDTGAAFVVIVHLDPEVRSELAAILRTRTEMPVLVVDETTKLLGNSVYVIAPNRRLHIADHMIAALPFDEPRGLRAPIDLFFRSLADHHNDGFAIILTGAGGDGAMGVKAIKEAGGIVLVQDPNEAEYSSMPRSAVAMQVADFVLPLRQLAVRLAELLHSRENFSPLPGNESDEEVIRRVLAHVRVRTGHDFTQYKRPTVFRRIARRVQVTRTESLSRYYDYLRETPEEVQALFSDFLISVTMFFRDAQAFASLQQNVIPQLFDGKEAAGVIRVWVSGCATGEEAYTIGMLLLEEASRRDLRPEIQVFGSDLDAGALSIAREGRFPAAIEADLSEERLRRFFKREGDHYRVRTELRDIVLFAAHSLLKDPPFSRVDLISCRNLLIYLDRDLQQQVCNTFHYALKPGGCLFLGSSENADQPIGLFRPVDRDARIYRAIASGNERRLSLPILSGAYPALEMGSSAARLQTPAANANNAALHRQMLEQIAPPSMLVDEAHHAIHLSNSAGRYLQPSGGSMSTDAADLVRPELRFDLRSALHRAFERGEPTLSMPIPVRFNGSAHPVYLHVKPVLQDGDSARYSLVIFIEGDAIVAREATGDGFADQRPFNETIQQLQDELQLAQSRLRATREESEGANEELRAANEELQSINEEYRSTSEELETSKEELQSINEELQTVNNELKLKLESVSRAHSDLQNLMAATDMGTLFLDTSMRIKRFTPQLTDLFNITISDEGRPITDFTHQLNYDLLTEHALAVLRDLIPIEHEVQRNNERWYLVRIRPYRTVDGKIDGVVATFLDVTERRKAEEALRHSEERLKQDARLIELSRSPIFIWDLNDGVVQWNRGSEAMYGYNRSEAIGQNKERMLKTIVPGSSFDALRQSLIENGTWHGEILHTTKDGRVLTVESQIELISSGDRRLVLESTRDITDQKNWLKRQTLLLDELTHRVKNTLTVVQSIARQTLRTVGSKEDFVERFEGRLLALSNSHKLLVDTNWEGAELGDLVRSQLEAHVAKDPGRLGVEGEPVMLPPEIATPFGLVFHELATNAAKYGSFSAEAGRVTLSWTLSGENRRRLGVTWQESGGPAVVKPERNGFGSVLIERGLPGAVVRRDFAEAGFICHIELTLPDAGAPSGEQIPNKTVS